VEVVYLEYVDSCKETLPANLELNVQKRIHWILEQIQTRGKNPFGIKG
jgi:hypothetical protein